jgi:hypothetical protein
MLLQLLASERRMRESERKDSQDGGLLEQHEKGTWERKVVHPERFELPTNWFEASYSIHLSYGCTRLFVLQDSADANPGLLFHLFKDVGR